MDANALVAALAVVIGCLGKTIDDAIDMRNTPHGDHGLELAKVAFVIAFVSCVSLASNPYVTGVMVFLGAIGGLACPDSYFYDPFWGAIVITSAGIGLAYICCGHRGVVYDWNALILVIGVSAFLSLLAFLPDVIASVLVLFGYTDAASSRILNEEVSKKKLVLRVVALLASIGVFHWAWRGGISDPLTRQGVAVGSCFSIGYYAVSCYNQAKALHSGDFDRDAQFAALRVKETALREFSHAALWNRAWGGA